MIALGTAPATFPTPWAARAFALVSAIAEAGWFDHRQFQQALIAAIQAREVAGGCIGDESAYYDCWLESLTALLREGGVPADRLKAAEAVVRDRFAALRHSHDHEDDHDEAPHPIHVEPAR